MKNRLIFSIIILLISIPCFSGEMERNVAIALMSYDKPRIYKENMRKELNKIMGRNMAIFLTSTYQILKYDKIQIPIRINNINYVANVDKNSIHIFYKKEF